jgi:diguanylate cyclase (GGDEF)-like protein
LRQRLGNGRGCCALAIDAQHIARLQRASAMPAEAPEREGRARTKIDRRIETVAHGEIGALARARRSGGRFSLVFLDLDKFKQVNDNYGHTVGDRLLQEVARRLLQCVREADSVARIGGDEFVLLLEDVEHLASVERVTAKLRQELGRGLCIDGHPLRIIPSIGLAHYPEDGDRLETLLKHADAAMYREKRAGQAFELGE